MFGHSEIKTCFLQGGKVVDATVEVNITNGIGIHIVGLPDKVVRENLLRVVTAIDMSGWHLPGKKIVVRVHPVEAHKIENTAAFDLPIAVGILDAGDQIAINCIENFHFYGELALDGTIREAGGEIEVLGHVRELCGGLVLSESVSEKARKYYGSNYALYACKSLKEWHDYARVCW